MPKYATHSMHENGRNEISFIHVHYCNSDYKQKQQSFSALSFLLVQKAEIISFLVYWWLYSALYSTYSYDHKIHQN